TARWCKTREHRCRVPRPETIARAISGWSVYWSHGAGWSARDGIARSHPAAHESPKTRTRAGRRPNTVLRVALRWAAAFAHIESFIMRAVFHFETRHASPQIAEPS